MVFFRTKIYTVKRLINTSLMGSIISFERNTRVAFQTIFFDQLRIKYNRSMLDSQ